ncbi:unnamed protein product [Pleuronectes platessa]|uniref:Secreted protein n=1 Tax=Pleuronectes platessa TaxID=8262 RepID=A0A9N7VGM8_PLEPL|nr:unnamed protein product [Pleuronectes platessa]
MWAVGLTFISQLWFSGNADMEKAQSRHVEPVAAQERGQRLFTGQTPWVGEKSNGMLHPSIRFTGSRSQSPLTTQITRGVGKPENTHRERPRPTRESNRKAQPLNHCAARIPSTSVGGLFYLSSSSSPAWIHNLDRAETPEDGRRPFPEGEEDACGTETLGHCQLHGYRWVHRAGARQSRDVQLERQRVQEGQGEKLMTSFLPPVAPHIVLEIRRSFDRFHRAASSN